MENISVGMTLSDLGQTRVYPFVSDFHDLSAERYPVRLMNFLGVHQHITRYALTHSLTISMQLPATPNPPSSEAVTGKEKKINYDEEHKEEEEEEDGEEQKHKRNKRFKSTKSSDQTKMRVPKVSFITKSEVDHLDDGYKWRKYGQKPVKNSPFPRNYYRCTTSWCDVKKRVERSFSDPSTVITTYEGQHTHPRPVLIMPKRGSFRFNGSASRAHFGLPTLPPHLHDQLFDHNNHQQQGLSSSRTDEYINSQGKGFDHDDDHHAVKKSRTRDLLDGAGFDKDQGLLQDVVSSHIVKEEY